LVGLGLVTGYAAVVSGEDARSIKRSKRQASLVGCALDAVTMQARLKRFVAISPSRRQGKFRCYSAAKPHFGAENSAANRPC